MPADGIRRHSGALQATDRNAVVIHQHPSPNCGPRRDGLTPTHVVVHYTAMVSAEAAIARLCDPAAEVSAHYVICKSGRITQLVSEGLRAWHAGVGQWAGLDDMNSRSIGIELDNDGQGPFSDSLMRSLEHLLKRILTGWQIPAHNVIGHSDMAPGRKFDPGPWFDWPRLEAQGLARQRGHGTGPAEPTLDHFARVAHGAGYTAPTDPQTLLSAVRLRYRPFKDGPVEAEDFSAIGRAALWT